MSLTLARNCNQRNRSKKISCAYSGSRLPSRQSTDFAQCQHERTALAALRACNACKGPDGHRWSVNQSGAFHRFQRGLKRNGAPKRPRAAQAGSLQSARGFGKAHGLRPADARAVHG